MTTHTDRIRQMAQEAGASFDPTFESVGDNPAFIMSPEQLTRFAQLVAEDCARVAGAAMERENVRTKDAPSDAIRARYSLKD